MNENRPTPSEADQQWLKDLLSSATTDPPSDTPPPGASFDSDDEQWLKDLFASAEQAADIAFSAEAPEEEVPLVEDFHLPDDFEAEIPQQEAEPAKEMPPLIETPKAPPAPPVVDEDEDDEDDEEDDDEDDEEEDEKDNAPSKRRPKNKDSYGLFGIPQILVTFVWLAIILAIGGFLGNWLWNGASDVLAFGREDKVVTITITENDDLDAVINKLHSAGLINEPTWFRLYAQISDVMEDIGTGTFELNTLYDYRALVTHMSPNSSARVTIKVRIPEGGTCAEIFALLEEKGVCTAAELEAAAMSSSIKNYWFLDGVARDHKYCLEGFLFPDTYEFYVGDDGARVLNTLLSNFDTRFTDIMMAKLDTLNETLAEMMRKNGMAESYIESHKFTIRQVVIIASLIEKETAGAAEGYTISSVIYNRLTNPVHYPYLNIDASLVYITGNSQLTEADKLLDNPYNTYLYPGLIPGAICNPSRTSLDAALDPSATGYYFYAFNPATNEHHFSETYEDHQKFLDSLNKEETP